MGFLDRFFGKNKIDHTDFLNNEHRIYSHDNLKSESYERYILVKGENLRSVESKLKDFGELPAKGNTYTYKFLKAQLGDWTIIKLPYDYQDYFGFHNIVYCF